MKDYKIALISPMNRAKSPRPPIALMCLAAYLMKNEFQVDIIDIKSDKGDKYVLEKTIEELKKIKPNCIGITCLTPDVSEVKLIASEIKKNLGYIKIVLGGIHPALFPEEFLYEKSPIDIVVTGEGEISITEICNNLMNNQDYKNVKGIAYFEGGRIIKTPPQELIQDLDSFPFLPYEKIDMDYYTKPSLFGIRGIPISAFYVLSTRGCPYRCRFCVEKNAFGKKIRSMSAKRVVDEIEYLVKKYKIDGIVFMDDTFTADKQRALDICKEIRKRKLHVLWNCQTRVNLLNDELLKAMAKAGCIQIGFGVESGSQRMLDSIQKLIKVEDVPKAFKLCKKYRIRQFANFMINLPDETLEDLNKTIKLAKEIKANLTVFNVTTAYPGTDLYHQYCSNRKFTDEEYAKLANYESYYEFLDFIESNMRIAAYNTPFKKILEKLWVEFPGTKDFKLKLNIHYFKSVTRAIDFLWHPKYLKQLFYSKKKLEYLKWPINFFKNKN